MQLLHKANFTMWNLQYFLNSCFDIPYLALSNINSYVVYTVFSTSCIISCGIYLVVISIYLGSWDHVKFCYIQTNLKENDFYSLFSVVTISD